MRSIGLLILLPLATQAGAGAGAANAAGVCDGAADAAAALNAMMARGGTVTLPDGVCVLGATLFVPSHTRLSGTGNTVLRATPDPSFPVVMVGRRVARGGADDVDVSGLTVDGAARRHGPRLADGIAVVSGSTHVTIHDVDVHDAGDNGIEAGGDGTLVTRATVHDNWTNGIYVIGVSIPGAPVRATGTRIIANTVSHNSRAGLPPASPSWDGIDVDPTTADALIERNTVVGNDIILFETARAVPYSGGHRVRDNIILDSPENGIDVLGPIERFELTGNRIERTTGWGIILNGPVRQGIVRDNTILGSTKAGIVVQNGTPNHGAPDSVEITGNRLSRTGPIVVRGGATRVRLSGNTGAPMDLRGAGDGLDAR